MISTAKNDVIYFYVWSGDGKRARDLVDSLYPGTQIRKFPHRRLREGSTIERIGLLRGIRGRAIVFYFESLDEFKYRQIFNCIHFLHRCRETVLCDDGGRRETMRTADILRLAPRVFFYFLLDLKTLTFWWFYLHLRLLHARPSLSENLSKREHPHRGLSTALRFGRDDKGEGGASKGERLTNRSLRRLMGIPANSSSSDKREGGASKGERSPNRSLRRLMSTSANSSSSDTGGGGASKGERLTNRSRSEIAYLIPSTAALGMSGGAISHVRGFLHGLKTMDRSCRVFSGAPLAQNAFETEIVDPGNRPFFFWEAGMLAYNLTFTRGVQKYLASKAPEAIYQRHCRFSIAGALLSSRLKIPLILEYNGPEGWIADHWDPTPFRSWVRLCEEVTLRCAARIIVVSEALRADLSTRGIPEDRMRVNPNAVDPDFFYPGRGGGPARKKLGIAADEILVGFAGSFSLWHGIEILQHAIAQLLVNHSSCRLRFVLMGHGLLHGEMRSALADYENTGEVIFTGSLPSDKVADYLDGCDILVSPHIPMPDGSRFFGSPTKIFEYMAMGKGIVASRLEQIAEVLEHDETAWLITPGDVNELAQAILRLALDPAKRKALGEAARHAAVERHSWVRNVQWALSDMAAQTPTSRAVVRAVDGSMLAP